MLSEVHQIQSQKLKPFIQYILYNQYKGKEAHSSTSFPNTNICVGISKGNLLHLKGDTYESKKQQNPIFAYTTGLYRTPHEFNVVKDWDEICIDFSPCGYFNFFDIHSKPKLIEDGFTGTLFKKKELHLLEHIFDEPNLKKRSLRIETFLLSKLQSFEKNDLLLAIEYIHSKKGLVNVKNVLKYTKCSERRVYRLFEDHFGITPKLYMRILKIRRALQLLTFNPLLSLTDIAYRCGYTDQSHFIKESKLMCNTLPKTLRNSITSIDNEVLIKKPK